MKLVGTEDLNCFVEPLQLMKKELIVLAVNNANDPSAPGGSHWSLLIYTLQVFFNIYFILTRRKSDIGTFTPILIFNFQAEHFYHFDSSSGMNTDDARALSKKIYTYLKCSKSDSSKSNMLPFTETIDVGLYSKRYLDGIYLNMMHVLLDNFLNQVIYFRSL